MIRYQIRINQLANGMYVYSQPGDKSNLSSIGVCAGSIHTPSGKVGLPHLVEHLLCKHSTQYTEEEVNSNLLRYCGLPDERGIYTTFNRTVYGHDATAHKTHMLKTFGMFANMLEERFVDSRTLQVEKAAVHQEYWLRGKNNPESEINEALRAALYSQHSGGIHPISLRVDAEIPDLKSITLGDINNFAAEHYVPNNMFMIMLGPKTKEVLAIAEKTFGHWPAKPARNLGLKKPLGLKRFSFFEPMNKTVRRDIYFRGANQVHAAVGFRTGHYDSPDVPALTVLANLLHHRLIMILRDKNTDFNKGCYRVYCENERTSLHGMLAVQFATLSQDFAEHAYDTILKQVGDLANKLPSSEEFIVAQHSVRNSFQVIWRSAVFYVADYIGDCIANGDPYLVGLHNYPKAIMGVTRKKITEVARKYLTGAHAAVFLSPRRG